MVLIQKKYNTIFLAVIVLVLVVSMFYWIHFLTIHQYIIECFSSATSDSVDLPLTTKYSCRNFCGPNSRCSITGQQCSADIDCPGCQPYSPPLPSYGQPIPGDNAAGKLTFGQTPQYSSLTSGFGTKERVITNNMFSKPVMSNFGGNMWFSQFVSDKDLFDKRYRPGKFKNMPNYPERYSLTGQFVEDGPFPANSPDL